MFTFIVTLMVISGLLLVLVVLAQNSKGGGLSSQFGGGGSTSQIMGVKRTGDLLERFTWGLAIVILVLGLSSHIYLPKENQKAGLTSPNLERAQEQQTLLPPQSTDIPLQDVDSAASDPALEGLTDEN
jgi:preprotein translocase subunit SecG